MACIYIRSAHTYANAMCCRQGPAGHCLGAAALAEPPAGPRPGPANLSERFRPQNQFDTALWPGCPGQRAHGGTTAGRWQAPTIIFLPPAGRFDRLHDPGGGHLHRGVPHPCPHVLTSTLRPDGLVVMENLLHHKSDPTLALMRRAGTEVRSLPAYSPDLNPIEKMWSKLKAPLRAAEVSTPATLVWAISQAPAHVTRARRSRRARLLRLWLLLRRSGL
jgi:transposase